MREKKTRSRKIKHRGKVGGKGDRQKKKKKREKKEDVKEERRKR